MRVWKTLVFGTAAVGILLAGGLAVIMPGQAAGDGTTSVTVPVGKVGDTVAYSSFQRNLTSEAWRPADGWSFRIHQRDSALDNAGFRHDVMQVLFEKTSWEGAEAPHEWRGGHARTLMVDLSSRDAIGLGYDYREEHTLTGGLVSTYGLVLSDMAYGPYFQYYHFPVAGDGHEPAIGRVSFVLEHQGAVYRVGQRLDPAATHLLDAEWILRHKGVSLTEVNSEVVGLGKVDGIEAFDVRTSGCARLEILEPDRELLRYWKAYPSDQEARAVPFLHARVPSVSTVCFVVDSWVSAASAYPVLYEERVMVDGAEVHSWLESVAHQEPGSEPIPWGADSAPYHYLTADPTLARSAGRVPQTGLSAWPPYSLEAARSALEADASLVDFQRWRSSNPDHVVAGMRFSMFWRACGTPAWPPTPDPLPIWLLVYGVPRGEFFPVFSVQRSATLPPFNCQAAGPLPGPVFRLEDMPHGPITIGAAVQRWHQVHPGVELGNGFLHWGMSFACPVASVGSAPGACPLDSPPRIYPAGNSHGVWDLIRIVATEIPTERENAGLRLGAPDGALIFSYDYTQSRVPQATLLSRPEQGGPPSASLVTPATPAIPYVAWAATVATGVLTFVAIAYLAPFLKYYGAQALILLPGYAKLRREGLLDHRTRDSIMAIVRTEPGISPPELHARVGGGWSTVVYHLRVLERNRLVSSLIDGRHKRFFPTDTIDWSKRGQIAALRNPKTRRVYETISGEPGLAQSALAHRIGHARATAQWHVERLSAAGLVAAQKRGHRLHYYARPPGPLYDPVQGNEVA